MLSVSEAKELTDKLGEDSLGAKRRAIGGEEFGCSWWWLRTQGNTSSRVVFIGPRSSIRSYARVNLARYGVRPALKIDLDI